MKPMCTPPIVLLIFLLYSEGAPDVALQISTEKQVYATETDVEFLAVFEDAGPLEFYWRFGDSEIVRTTSRTFIKRFLLPDRYNVTVRVSGARGSVTSEVYPVVIQTAVRLNRLLYPQSVLLDTVVTFSCRINSGSDQLYLWNFGDGSLRHGHSTEHHVYNRTGEFTVEVTVFNLVSSASLKGRLFVVSEPCQPPPVKNMGPGTIQVWRYEPVTLGVTFESQIQCNISRGLRYSWTLYTQTGQQLHIPHIHTDRQSLSLPQYLLHYGTYTATAKVEIVGSIVYSNYSVQIEVMSSSPVSVISRGTHVFISRKNNNNHNVDSITLEGHKSYDPDFPDNPVSYKWKCRAVKSAESSCFTKKVLDNSSVLTFPVKVLQPHCDLFKLTLTVHSKNRSASSDVFITVRSQPTSLVQILCEECRGNSVNWNKLFSVSAECEHCPETFTYSWKLYLVNASSKIDHEVPFCSSMDINLLSKVEETTLLHQIPEVTTQTLDVLHSAVLPNVYMHSSTDSVPSAQRQNGLSSSYEEFSDINNTHHSIVGALEMASTSLFQPLSRSEGSLRIHRRSQRSVGSSDFLLTSERSAATDASGDFREDYFSPDLYNIPSDYSSAHGELDYELFHSEIEEGDGGKPVGRPTGPYDLAEWTPDLEESRGENLVDPSRVKPVLSEKTLLDLDRDLIQPTLFQSYTLTGTSSSIITFKPTTLRPKTLYMLEVSASFEKVLQGKSQLFFRTHSSPDGTVCQVQPSSGLEIHTHFSVFCTSGKQDLLYDYSFTVGKSSKQRLYEGRDFQHYFYLPAGDPHSNHEVTVYIEIRSRFGSATKPCPVTVTVLPSFQRNSSFNPDQDLFVYGLGNVSSLMLTGNSRDIINYVSLLTTVLNRLSLDPESSAKLQTQIRASLISALCHLTVSSQDLLLDILRTLTDLLKVSTQVTFESANLATKCIHHLSSQGEFSLSVDVVKKVVFVLSKVLEVPVPFSRPGFHLKQSILHIITDSVLMFTQSSRDRELSVNSTFMKLMVWKNYGSAAVKNLNMTTVYIPDLLDTDKEEQTCFITQLISYKHSPYQWARTPTQLNRDVAEIKLFNCTSRVEIRRRHLSTPVIIEFQTHEERYEAVEFTLVHFEGNTHLFTITPELLQKSLQLTVQFSRPGQRPFPIMLLFRMHKRPTPTLYITQEVYHWKRERVQIFLPSSSLTDAGMAYLMLLNADYDKVPFNKYTAKEVNYTLSIESLQCLSWDDQNDWTPEGCTVLKSFTSSKINCSCSQLSSFTVTHQLLQSNHSVVNISEFISSGVSLTSCFLIAATVALYTLLLVFSKLTDIRTERSSGTFLLPDNRPSDQFLYAVTIHTGLRSRATMTAKVYIILYGENGVSQTRELSNSGHKLFTSNSTNTFILSSAVSLGQVWEVYLWHDGSGSSPSWFVGGVLVEDLLQGCGWRFQAQCWLAVDEGDGRVERRLSALEEKLTFRERLYLKLSDYVKDFHPWLSIYTCPSFSAHTHTQRMSVCFLLLQAYMCANTWLIYLQEEQYFSELGVIGVSLDAVITGLCAVTLLPVGTLVSCLFRISKLKKKSSNFGDQYKVRLPFIYPEEASETNMSLSRASSLKQNRVRYEQGVQDWKNTHDTECVTCNKLTDNSKLQSCTDSSSRIEVIEEDTPENTENLQNQRIKNSRFRPQSYSSEDRDSPEAHQFSCDRSNTLQVWCYYLTWALWLCLCLTFMIITATLGLKFSSTQNLLWIQSVFFSLIICVFAVHPALILISVICVTLRRGERGYFYNSSSFNEVISELLRYNQRQEHHLPSFSPHQPETRVHFQKVLEARQRERRLRLARPPTSAQLKCVRSRIKRRTVIWQTIRELVSYALILSVAGFVAYGKFSNNTFHLNQAIKTWLKRDLHRTHYSLQNPDTWWSWTEKALLVGLYQQDTASDGTNDSTKSLRGTFFPIGEAVFTAMEYTASSHQILSFSGFSSRPQLCGKLWCYKGTGIHIHLGKNRSETSSKLQNLSRNTKAMLLQFTVYNPPYNLFITVTVLREWSQTGAFQPLIFIHSSRLYSSDTALHHCLTAAELLFLLFTLLQFYFHMCVIPQSGWSYWRNRWNWIEVITLLLSLLSFFFTVHHFTLRTDVVEQLQRGDFKAFVDITPVSSWEQTSRSLHGILVFLLLMKCLHVLRLNEVMTAAVSTTSLIFSGLLWPLIFFVILVMAVSCLGNLLFRSDTSAFSTFLRSVYWVTSQCLSVGKLRFLCRADLKTQTLLALTFYGALLFIVSVVLKAAVTGALCSYIKTAAKSKSRKPLISICDLLSYTRDMALGFIDRHRKDWIDNYSNTNNLYLEEFEELVDELLLRLSVMSNSDCHKEQENYVNQRNLSSARDNSLEAAELEEVMIPVELEHSFVWSVSSHTYEEHDENNLRSPQEWKSLEDFEGNREILTDRPTSKRQKIQNKIQRKTKGTLHCGTQTIKVQMEYSDTLNSNRTKQEDYSLDKPVRRSQTQLNTGLNSSPGNLTSYSSHIEAYEHFCTCKPTVEKRQPHSEEQRVNIPGQCC